MGRIRACTLIGLLLIGVGLWECGLGWMQLLGLRPSLHSLYPATGTFYNPGPYCCFLAMIMPVALYYALNGRRCRWMQWTGLAYIIPAMAIMPVLMGRTGWIAAAAGCVITSIGCGRFGRPKPGALAAAAVLAAAGATFLFYLKPASALGRLFLWRVGISAALKRPLTGAGWDHVAGALGDAQEEYFHTWPDSDFTSVAGTPEYAFNEFLQTGIAFGIPAMGLFVAVLVWAAVVSWRGGSYGITGGIVAFAIVCSSSYPFQFPLFIASAAMMIAGAIAAAPCLNRLIKAGGGLVLGALTYICCYGQYQRISMATDWTKNRYICQYRLDDKTIHRLDSLDEIYGASARFLFDYGKALREAGRLEESTEVLQRGVRVSADPMFLNLIGRNFHDAGRFSEAEQYFLRAIDRLPGRMYPYYLLARLYADPAVGDSARFMTVYGAAVSMEPKVMSPAIRQMRRELDALRDSIKLQEPASGRRS